MTAVAMDEALAAALQRALQLLAGGQRRILGIAGPPGAGKSSVAEWLAEQLPGQAIVVPMDGYHLANVQLQRLDRRARKGAPDTFDAEGYVALLQRLRDPRPGEIVYAPAFRREIDEPIAAEIAVPAEIPLVITEGNYLLLDDAPWDRVRGCLDDSWFVDVDPERRRAQLVARHMHFGRSREEAEAWATGTDEPNAVRILASRRHALFPLRWPEWSSTGDKSLDQANNLQGEG
ncbi:nucleoside/nucleotide kinase family protein [Frateuria aurantia]